MVNMIKAGEVGGFLDSVLLQIAENYEAEVKLRGKIKSAMTYPVVVFIMAILMCSACCCSSSRSSPGCSRPWAGSCRYRPRSWSTLSDILKMVRARSASSALSPSSSCGARSSTTSGCANVIDPLKLKLPVFGQLFQKIALSRFSRNLGTMMHSGVPILQSLDIVADTTGNIVLARAVRDVQESVRTGESLAGPADAAPGLSADGRADDGRR